MRRDDSDGALPSRSKSCSTDGEDGPAPLRDDDRAPSAATVGDGAGHVRARRCNRAALCRVYRCMTSAAVARAISASRTRSIASLSSFRICLRFDGMGPDIARSLSLAQALSAGSWSVCTASSCVIGVDAGLEKRPKWRIKSIVRSVDAAAPVSGVVAAPRRRKGRAQRTQRVQVPWLVHVPYHTMYMVQTPRLFSRVGLQQKIGKLKLN